MLKKKKPSVSLPDFKSEATLGFFASKIIIGVDEVGRGCLAGPVVAAAVVLKPESIFEHGFLETGARPRQSAKSKASFLCQVKDSKLVPIEGRAELAQKICDFAHHFAVGEASVSEIDELNILYASHLAMERAVFEIEQKIGQVADAVLIDGNLIPKNLKSRGHAIVKGDLKSVTIACASIIAKVHRDRLMHEYESQYPGYGMAKHKGYGTAFHLLQLNALGVTPIHRRDFKGVNHLISADSLVEDFE